MICQQCGMEAPKRGAMQRYCAPCSEKRDLERKRLWAREHPKTPIPGIAKQRREECKAVGAATNREFRQSISWAREPIDFLWYVRIAYPFGYQLSKNHIYTKTRFGHVALRHEATSAKNNIILLLRESVKQLRPRQNKVWIDMLVQKPNHKGDAINVIDLVADAIKIALDVDDRWFCIRHVDWEITKTDPKIFIGVGQESDIDLQACSTCGQLKEFNQFNKNSSTKQGVGRICKDCRTKGAALSRRMKKAVA